MTRRSQRSSEGVRTDDLRVHCVHGAGTGAGAAAGGSLPRQRGPRRCGRRPPDRLDRCAVCTKRRTDFCRSCRELAQRLAAVCHAVPVITTATDGRGVFAVDEWAKRQNCAVAEPERIRCVSGALLAGQSVCYAADWAVSGTPPAGVEPAAAADRADFALTLTPTGEALHLIPRIAVLGVGTILPRRALSAQPALT